MKDCILITHKTIKLLLPNKKELHPDLRAVYKKGYLVIWNKDHTQAANCIWVSTYCNPITYKDPPSLSVKDFDYEFDDNGILFVKKLKEIPVDYYGPMSVPLTWAFYDYPDYEYISETYGPLHGKTTFFRYRIKRKQKTNEA